MKKILFFNTFSRREEEFVPLKEGHVGLYTCGPTVYNFAHIGNFRAYVFEDILRRTLKYFGYKVFQVMNLTDVDDKTIRGAISSNLKLNEFTEQFKKAFFEDIEILRIERAEVYPAATEHINEMIELIKTLEKKGFAYKADDNSVYFSVAKFANYGKLSKIDMQNQIAGVRIKADEYSKENTADFALWKAWDENDGDVYWDSPWGKGRPGWHIECSAMSMKYLGKTFDIHTGGIDNMFPHHEDEIAQSEAANEAKFVNYWLHCEHLLVNGQKMSKSMNNFYTLRDLLGKGFSGRQIRFLLLSTHYRKKLNFTMEICDKAGQTLENFDNFFRRLAFLTKQNSSGDDAKKITNEALDKFETGIAKDLNISESMAAIHFLTRETNKLLDAAMLSSKGAQNILDTFRKFDSILAVYDVDNATSFEIPDQIMKLVEERQNARKDKNYELSDILREKINSLGWLIEDTPQGPRIKEKKS